MKHRMNLVERSTFADRPRQSARGNLTSTYLLSSAHCQLLPWLILLMESETPSSLPQTPSSLDSRFSSPFPDLLQSPISTSRELSRRRTFLPTSSTASRLSSTCSLTSCWILSSSEMILSLVFPVSEVVVKSQIRQLVHVCEPVWACVCVSPRSVTTLSCLCTLCSRPFRVSLMELKVRITSESWPCTALSWSSLMEPPITLCPSSGFSVSRPDPLLLPPGPSVPPGVESI